MSKPWHAVETDEAMRALNVTHDGLTSQEAQERLKKYGYNELKEKKRSCLLYTSDAADE
mgnify:CR=1 FL=1